MTRYALLILLLSSNIAAAQSAAPMATIDNANVTVWDVAAANVAATGGAKAHDAVVVYIAPETAWGKVDFVPQGGDVAAKVKAAGATRAVVVSLKEKPAPALPNTSGYPDAFPRPGNLKKPLDNARITVWDFVFEPGVASPMHFHGHDVVTIYLKEGALVSTAPDGTKTSNEFSFGTIRFNPRNRTHTETVVRGQSHIISIELK